MKKYLLIGLTLLLLSCNNSAIKEEKKDKRTELIVREPLKSILDSLIAIDANKDLIQEICLERYAANDYRISIISRSYSLDKTYGKPINYFISNEKKIDIYTGLEYYFQPIDSVPFKEEKQIKEYKEYIRYRIIEFHVGEWKNKLEDLKIWEVPDYIPFLEISSDFKTE